MGKIRTCGDLKYGCGSLGGATRTPISLPTRGHIGQICLNLADPAHPWSFFNVDHKAAYRNFPHNPDQADACVATLRNPQGGLRYGFRPRSLLFGAAAAVLRYNCSSRIIASSACRILGIPAVNHFDGFGAPVKSSTSDESARVSSQFCQIPGFILKDEKAGLRRKISFIGGEGHDPVPDNEMILPVDLTDAKKRTCEDRLNEVRRIGPIGRKGHESATGRRSFSQTSIFGRFLGEARRTPSIGKPMPYIMTTIRRIPIEWFLHGWQK